MQRSSGFIGDPIGQLKLLANLSKFRNDKLILDSGGECGSNFILLSN